MPSRVVLFVFAGRQPNMELQLPFIRRILKEHPHAEYHVWNLCRTTEDDAYVRSIKGDRITVRNDFYGGSWNDVWRHYAEPEYRDCLFVKLDDDVVFLQTHRFGQFIDAIEAHPRGVISANVVNNGACTALEQGLRNVVIRLRIPLLDVHMSSAYAEGVHRYFFKHSAAMLAQEVELIPADDWLSINVIGFDWANCGRIAVKLDKPHPVVVAGRRFERWQGVGDEGSVNTLPRIIMRGFVAGHLTFGPQSPTDEQLAHWRGQYAKIGDRYLASTPSGDVLDLPELSPQTGLSVVARWAADNWRARHQPAGDNDPLVGRYVN